MLTRERFLKIRETVIGAIDKLSEDEANALADILEISSEVMEAWHTRPSAPVDGLETVEYHYFNSTQGTWLPCAFPEMARKEGKETRELVTRSQAVAIIAAERSRADKAEADAEKYREYAAEKSNQVATLQKDNTALTARVKELEELLRISESCNHFADNLSKEMRTLETQLSATKKALERAVYGFDQIHKSLMNNGPKQASGEVTAFFLAEANAALEDRP